MNTFLPSATDWRVFITAILLWHFDANVWWWFVFWLFILWEAIPRITGAVKERLG